MRIDVEKIDDTNETWSMPSQRALQPAVPLVLEPPTLVHDTKFFNFLRARLCPCTLRMLSRQYVRQRALEAHLQLTRCVYMRLLPELDTYNPAG